MEAGIKGKKRFMVTRDKLASEVGSGKVDVYATPMMIAAIEETAAASVESGLAGNETSVGTNISVSHIAATPEGMEVRIETELTKAEGRKLSFRVSAYDEAGLIGEGTHERVIVNKERFEQKARQKLS